MTENCTVFFARGLALQPFVSFQFFFPYFGPYKIDCLLLQRLWYIFVSSLSKLLITRTIFCGHLWLTHAPHGNFTTADFRVPQFFSQLLIPGEGGDCSQNLEYSWWDLDSWLQSHNPPPWNLMLDCSWRGSDSWQQPLLPLPPGIRSWTAVEGFRFLTAATLPPSLHILKLSNFKQYDVSVFIHVTVPLFSFPVLFNREKVTHLGHLQSD